MYEPPRPLPLSPLGGLVRAMLRGGDLLSLLPRDAYRVPAGYLGYSRRSILIVNAPELTRPILNDPADIFPKNDLMTGALEPLVGQSIFVSNGDLWRRQRRMIDPAFSHMRLNRAFTSMVAAVDDHEAHLAEVAARGETISLDLAMSHLTADVITRTVFSSPLQSRTAKDVYEAFSLFERSVANVELKRLIFDRPFADIPQHPAVLEACARIRGHLGALVDTHLPPGASDHNDIASALVGAADPESGRTFTRDELIDQLGVFFLAGHETTASALTWAFFILSTQADVLARVRAEVEREVGDGPIEFDAVRRLAYTRNVFKETLRLYPPITFLPRVALEPVTIGPFRVKRGAMIMVAPWTIHRHRDYWKDPAAFDPDRFGPEREKDILPGTYLPFGQGPRVCVGANFAAMESALILARLVRRFDFETLAPESVFPAARLTTRPKRQVMMRVRDRMAARRPAAA